MKKGSAMKKGGHESKLSNPLNINELPEVLVQNILACLPIQDAVRTSILSRKWRYAWRELPKLVFDNNFCGQSIINTKSKLMMVIYQVLLLHRGPLHEFKLSLSNLDSSFSEIDQFLLVVLEKGVKEFTLCKVSDEPYMLPSSLFSYGLQLERLELSSCIFKPPPGYKGFSKLDYLVLEDVTISGSEFSSLIANCPLLKWLKFTSWPICSPIDVVAPNLKSFFFEGLCQCLCFKNTPKLERVEIYCGDNGLEEREAHSQFKLCGRLPVVEVLMLDYLYAKCMTSKRAASRVLVQDMRHLKTLCVWYVRFDFLDDVLSVLSLLKNFQNLEKLTIEAWTSNTVPDVELVEVEGFSDITFNRLRKVEIGLVSGFKSELQVIELILAKSPALKKFLIEPQPNLVGDKGFVFFKALSSFRRAAPLVEIVYEG